MTISGGAMIQSILDGPPELTEDQRLVAHGKLLLTALYEPDLHKRRAAWEGHRVAAGHRRC